MDLLIIIFSRFISQGKLKHCIIVVCSYQFDPFILWQALTTDTTHVRVALYYLFMYEVYYCYVWLNGIFKWCVQMKLADCDLK